MRYQAILVVALSSSLVGIGCKNDSSGASGSLLHTCWNSAGSIAELTPESGAGATVSVNGCSYTPGSKGVFFWDTTPYGHFFIYVRGSVDASATLTIAASQIASAVPGGFVDPNAAVATLDAKDIPDGTIMVSALAPTIGGELDYIDSEAGGTATLSISTPPADGAGGWPTRANQAASAAIAFESAVMHARRSPSSFRLRMRLSVRSSLASLPRTTSCTQGGAGGAGCLILDNHCTVGAEGACTRQCMHAICRTNGTSTTDGICCVPDGSPCGSAGTGTECCGGNCNAGRCSPEPARGGSCAVDAGGVDGGTSNDPDPCRLAAWMRGSANAYQGQLCTGDLGAANILVQTDDEQRYVTQTYYQLYAAGVGGAPRYGNGPCPTTLPAGYVACDSWHFDASTCIFTAHTFCGGGFTADLRRRVVTSSVDDRCNMRVTPGSAYTLAYGYVGDGC